MYRLTLILPDPAGIKEGLYDNEALSAYLLYRLNALNMAGTFIMYRNNISPLTLNPIFRT